MSDTLENIVELFKKNGGEFISSPSDIAEKLKNIKAILYDWDGVFNEGSKGGTNQSGFSEIDSMGTNMLRFSQWMNKEKKMPICGIITGAENYAAEDFAIREHFPKVYFSIPHKILALEHLEEAYGITPDEVMYFYDDILDLSVAEKVGIRIFIRSNAKVLFSEYVKQNKLADYVTAFSGGQHGVRETCEMLIGISGSFNSVIDNRVAYSESYQEYLTERKGATIFYTIGQDGKVIEHHAV